MEKDDPTDAVERWLVSMMRRVAGVLRRRGGSPPDAIDDLVQESVLRWWCSSDKMRVPSAASETTLLAIARRVWLESVRCARRRSRFSTAWASVAHDAANLDIDPLTGMRRTEDVAGAASAHELREQVARLLQRHLDPRQFEVFELVWLECCGWRVAASRCGLTPAAGEAARKKFRRFLSAQDGRRSLGMLSMLLGIESPTPNPEKRRRR